MKLLKEAYEAASEVCKALQKLQRKLDRLKVHNLWYYERFHDYLPRVWSHDIENLNDMLEFFKALKSDIAQYMRFEHRMKKPVGGELTDERLLRLPG